MARMIFDEEGLLEEPCLSCDNAYIENIWDEWCCDKKECPYKAESEVRLEQQPKTGHWIIISPTDMYCSECHETEHLDTSRKFCAFCGAKMVEPHESEDKE